MKQQLVNLVWIRTLVCDVTVNAAFFKHYLINCPKQESVMSFTLVNACSLKVVNRYSPVGLSNSCLPVFVRWLLLE